VEVSRVPLAESPCGLVRHELVDEEDRVGRTMLHCCGHRASHSAKELIAKVENLVVRQRPMIDQRVDKSFQALTGVRRLSSVELLLRAGEILPDGLTKLFVGLAFDRHNGLATACYTGQ